MVQHDKLLTSLKSALSKRALVIFALLFLAAQMYAATTHFTRPAKGSSNDTEALQQALNRMALGDTLIIDGDVHVSTLLLQDRMSLTIEIAGSLNSNLVTSQPKGGPSFSPSKNPVLAIAGGKDITVKSIGSGYLRNGYGEGIAAAGVDGLQLSLNINGAGVGDWDAIYLNGDKNVTISNCYLENASQLRNILRPGDKRVTSYKGNGISTYGVIGLVISNVSISRMSYDGIYLGSGTNRANPYKNTLILDNRIFDNEGSGIQGNFNKPGGIPLTDLTIAGNSIWDNVADGIDLNNTGSTMYPSYVLVKENHLFRNGWWKGQRTADGSGVATIINLSNATLANNIAIDPQRVGLFAELSSDITAYDNIVIKSADSSAYVADVEHGNNIAFKDNDLYVAQGDGNIVALRAYVSDGDNVVWSNNYLNGGYIEYPNFHAHVGSRLKVRGSSVLHVSTTPAPEPNFYRFKTGSNTDFVIAYSTNPVKIVAWSPQAQHIVKISLKDAGLSGNAASGTTISGKPVLPAPTLAGGELRLVISSTPAFLDIR